MNNNQANNTGANIRFRYNGRSISWVVTGDLDSRRAKRLLADFKQWVRCLPRCWTCFQRPRGVINYPCGCFCNCKSCSKHMLLCSMCNSDILGTHTASVN